jgi:hypothetical protein
VPSGCPARVCAACAPGRWKTRNAGSAAASDCRACGPGSVPTEVDARIMALADTNGDGLLSEVEFSTAGRPTAELAQIHSVACTACTAGKASMSVEGSAAGTGMCETCMAGQYASTGAARCTACPRGRYSNDTGNTDSNACVGCPTGQHSTTLGAAAVSYCVPCPAGSFPTGMSGLQTFSIAPMCLSNGTKQNSDAYECLRCGAGSTLTSLPVCIWSFACLSACWLSLLLMRLYGCCFRVLAHGRWVAGLQAQVIIISACLLHHLRCCRWYSCCRRPVH